MKLIVFLSLFTSSLGCSSRKTCETGWTQINRTLGVWCVQVVPSAVTLNYTAAAALCTDLGAVLSSIESQEEYEIEMGLIDDLNVTRTIVGSELTSECDCFTSSPSLTECPITTECTLITAYEWTDNFTVGTTVIADDVWPLYIISTTYFSYLYIYEAYIWSTSDAGLITSASQDSTATTGALCGKKAT